MIEKPYSAGVGLRFVKYSEVQGNNERRTPVQHPCGRTEMLHQTEPLWEVLRIGKEAGHKKVCSLTEIAYGIKLIAQGLFQWHSFEKTDYLRLQRPRRTGLAPEQKRIAMLPQPSDVAHLINEGHELRRIRWICILESAPGNLRRWLMNDLDLAKNVIHALLAHTKEIKRTFGTTITNSRAVSLRSDRLHWQVWGALRRRRRGWPWARSRRNPR